MAKMIFEIDDKLEEEFRNTVFQRKGLKRGVIKEALIEAMNLWIKSNVIKQLKDSISNSISSGQDYNDMVDALKSHGQRALPELIEIKDNQINQDNIRYLSKAIKEISENS